MNGVARTGGPLSAAPGSVGCESPCCEDGHGVRDIDGPGGTTLSLCRACRSKFWEVGR